MTFFGLSIHWKNVRKMRVNGAVCPECELRKVRVRWEVVLMVRDDSGLYCEFFFRDCEDIPARGAHPVCADCGGVDCCRDCGWCSPEEAKKEDEP